MAVRSRLLAIGNQVPHGTAVAVYTVPAGRTAIVRHWSVTNRSSETPIVLFNVRSGTTTATVMRHGALPVGSTMGEPQANLALGPGDKIEITGTAGGAAVNLHWVICGSLLEGEPE